MVHFILFLSLLWHLISIIMFLVALVAWFFVYFFSDELRVLFSIAVDDKVVVAALAVATVVALAYLCVAKCASFEQSWLQFLDPVASLSPTPTNAATLTDKEAMIHTTTHSCSTL
ncbi:PRA1 family protein F2 [Spatholobus suberectus]|nr:PRA1 family protein F2 [Spatholobus suberectus]